MEDIKERYKGNSHKSREQQNKPVEKKFNKVVKGNVKTKKNNMRAITNFLGIGDTTSIKSYILKDVLIPAIRDSLEDIASNTISIIFHGEPDYKRKSKIPGSNVSYSNYYNRKDSKRDYRRPTYSTQFDYEDVVLESRGDAEYVLNQMWDALEQYNIVTVADLCDLVGVRVPFTANNYGWDAKSFEGAYVEKLRRNQGYLLRLPKAEPID